MAGDESDIGKVLENALLRREAERLEVQRKLEQQPFQLPPITQTKGENFTRCLTPKAARDSYGFSSPELAVTQMMRELKHDRVQAVCHEAIIHLEDGKSRFAHAVVPSWFWYRSPPAADSDFWETGYLYTIVPKNEAGLGIQGSIEFFNVRIWPDGLPGGADNPVPASTDSGASAPTTPLPKAEADRVSKAILEIWGADVTEKRALEIARGICPEHRVSRDPFLDSFRAIRGHKNPGKPPSRG